MTHLMRLCMRRPVTMVVTLALVLAAMLAIHPPAASAAPSTTVRGVVTTTDGTPLQGVLVGTWSLTRGRVTLGRTDAEGRFSLRSPSDVPVVAFAGAKPNAYNAVFSLGGRHLVRGTIGRGAPTGSAPALAQKVTPTTPALLGRGKALHFRMRDAGRFTASSPLLGAFSDTTGEIDVQHGDGYGPSFPATADGTVLSGWLVPGRYRLYWAPVPPYLPTRTWLTVAAGRTTTAPVPDFETSADAGAITLHVTSGGKSVGAGLTSVQRVDGGAIQSVPSTDDTGTIELTDLDPGSYAITVGQRFDDPDEGLGGEQPTPDAVLPKTVTVTITGDEHVVQTVDLAPAAHISGTVAAPADAKAGYSTYSIYAEDAKGVIVRAEHPADDGTFTVGGLAGGQDYLVFVVDSDRKVYDVASVTVPVATASSSPVPMSRELSPGTPLTKYYGVVSGGKQGTIQLRSTFEYGPTYSAFDTFEKDGKYVVRTIPGVFDVTIRETAHVTRTYRDVRVWALGARDYAPGAHRGHVTATFTVDGRPVAVQAYATGTSPKGHVLLTSGRSGRAEAFGVTPTTYRDFRITTVPAGDGPWTYTDSMRTFTVRPGQDVRLGRIPLRIAG